MSAAATSGVKGLEPAGGLRRAASGLMQRDLGTLPVAVALLLIWTFFAVQFPVFLQPRNLSFLLLQISVLGLIAVGIVLVLLLGEIDLSAAATTGVCAAIVGVLLARYEWSVVPAVIVALIAGVAIGLFQSVFVAIGRVPSFVVTLGGLLGFQGLMLKILSAQGTVNVNDETLLKLAGTYLSPSTGWLLVAIGGALHLGSVARRRHRRSSAGLPMRRALGEFAPAVAGVGVAAVAVWRLNEYRGIPLAGLVLLAVVGAWSYVLRRTSFGRQIYSVGGNAEAARRAGVNVVRVRMAVMGLAGLMFAFGGVLGASRYASVSYNAFAGGSLLLEAIGAAVIGGTSLFGGRGRMSAALLGALVIGSLSNGLDLYRASSATKDMVTGAILLAAVTFDALARRRRAATGRG